MDLWNKYGAILIEIQVIHSFWWNLSLICGLSVLIKISSSGNRVQKATRTSQPHIAFTCCFLYLFAENIYFSSKFKSISLRYLILSSSRSKLEIYLNGWSQQWSETQHPTQHPQVDNLPQSFEDVDLEAHPDKNYAKKLYQEMIWRLLLLIRNEISLIRGKNIALPDDWGSDIIVTETDHSLQISSSY